MEPKSVNTLVDEAEALKEAVSGKLKGSVPHELAHLFEETSLFFQEEVLAEWRLRERIDELIDYVVYQYAEGGGEVMWKQVLLDLRLKKDDKRAFNLLEGLLPGRVKRYQACAINFKKYPNNYLSAASLAIATGEVMKVLYEYAYILENRPTDQLDTNKINKVKDKIEKILKKSF